MKYRICIATSGSYYVQKFNGYEYKMVGTKFFKTQQGARNYIDGIKVGDRCCYPSMTNVVEYR